MERSNPLFMQGKLCRDTYSLQFNRGSNSKERHPTESDRHSSWIENTVERSSTKQRPYCNTRARQTTHNPYRLKLIRSSEDHDIATVAGTLGGPMDKEDSSGAEYRIGTAFGAEIALHQIVLPKQRANRYNDKSPDSARENINMTYKIHDALSQGCGSKSKR